MKYYNKNIMNDNKLGTTFRANNTARPEYPADLLKFIACKKPVRDLDAAVNLIIDKHLVLGEPAVVPFYYTHNKEPKIQDPSTGEYISKRTIELLFAIGSLDPGNPYMNVTNNNIDTGVYNIINDAKIVDADGVERALIDVLNAFSLKFNDYVKKVDLEGEILKIFDNNPQLIEAIAAKVVVKPEIDEKIEKSVEVKTEPIKEAVVEVKTEVIEVQQRTEWKAIPKI